MWKSFKVKPTPKFSQSTLKWLFKMLKVHLFTTHVWIYASCEVLLHRHTRTHCQILKKQQHVLFGVPKNEQTITRKQDQPLKQREIWMRRVTERAWDTMKNDFIKTQSLKLREKLSAEFKRHATLLGLHKAPETSQEPRRKKEKKKSQGIAKVPHHYANAILFHFISVSFSTLAICAVAHVGASKGGSARPHANTPIWGSNSPSWSPHTGHAVATEMWSNVTADLCKTPSEETCALPSPWGTNERLS